MKLLRMVLFLSVLDCISSATSSENSDKSDSSPQHTGQIVQSLFRFPASQLGTEFNELLNLWYSQWLQIPSESTLPLITPDESGIQHAANSISATVATLFRRQCYGPLSSTQQTLYRNLEQRRKDIEFQYLNDPEEEMKLLHTMVKRFSPAFHLNEGGATNAATITAHIHKKKAKNTADTVYSLPPSLVHSYDDPPKLAFRTGNDEKNKQQWTWRPAGHFSSRGTFDNYLFRVNMFHEMRKKLQNLMPLEMGRQSGMFWYPPGSVREWHSNHLDLVGSAKGKNTNQRDEEIFASQVWRMYFVRTVRDKDFDEKLSRLRSKISLDGSIETKRESVNDHSAMHIIPGEDYGITLEVLQNAGARPLTAVEQMRQYSDIFAEDDAPKNDVKTSANITDESFDRKSVWRIPDQDGYVTLFRLPKIWHCIVSEEVHRYSLGFAFSDREVQGLLRLAGVEFDVENQDTGCNASAEGVDEL